MVGITRTYLSRVENNKQAPSQSLIFRMAKTLDVEPSEICVIQPEKTESDSLKARVDEIWAKLPKHLQAAVYANMEQFLADYEKSRRDNPS